MSTRPRSTPLTYEDFLLFPEDGKRHELMEGEHYVTPSPNTRHQTISSALHRILGPFIHEHRLGVLFAAPMDVVLSDIDVVEPDLLFVASARKTIIQEPHIHGAPDLVIEILSERTRKVDEVTKRKLYERYGVQEYWIVDPELELVKVYRLTGERYGRGIEVTKEGGEVLTTPLFSGLSLPLSDLFA